MIPARCFIRRLCSALPCAAWRLSGRPGFGAGRLSLTAASVPMLRRSVRRQFDAARNAPILMAPERVVMLDEIADAIITECIAGGSVHMIALRLAARFVAPVDQVEEDVLSFLQDLIDKGLMTI